jgi:hypothetical protein
MRKLDIKVRNLLHRRDRDSKREKEKRFELKKKKELRAKVMRN